MKRVFAFLLCVLLTVGLIAVPGYAADETNVNPRITVNDDIVPGIVILRLDQEYSDISPQDFPEVKAQKITFMYQIDVPDPQTHQLEAQYWYKMTLEEQTRQAVLDAIEVLSKREDVLKAEPDFYIYPEVPTINYTDGLHYDKDVNGDNKLNVEDALSVLRQLVGLEPAYNSNLQVEDAISILKMLVNLIPTEVYSPKGYETYQFTLSGYDAGETLGADRDKQVTVIINSLEEWEQFQKTELADFRKTLEDNNLVYGEYSENWKLAQTHFADLDESFFDDNVYAVTLKMWEPHPAPYLFGHLTDAEDGGLKLQITYGRYGSIYPDMLVGATFSGTVIPRTALQGKEITKFDVKEY